MTVKEIAELCGVDQSTVWRWAKESACKMPADIASKLDNAGHGLSADFTRDETLAIIGEGGGNKALASLLAENAANKDVLVKGRYAAGHYVEHIGPAAQAARQNVWSDGKVPGYRQDK